MESGFLSRLASQIACGISTCPSLERPRSLVPSSPATAVPWTPNAPVMGEGAALMGKDLKDRIKRRLTPHDRLRIFEKLGFSFERTTPNHDGGWTGNVRGPSELGEGDKPNFAVNLSNGGVKDHGKGGNGYTGDLLQAVRDVQRMDFPEALRFVAEQIGMDVPERSTPKRRNRGSEVPDWNAFEDGDQIDVYQYTDADGSTLFEVVRFEPKPEHPAHGMDKTFVQRVPGKGWGRAKHGIEATLYRLPDVLRAASERQIVFVVEGEKDVHTLERMGCVATTCPQGAGDWKDRFSRYLKGANVVLLPDNDTSGRGHMKDVAASVYEHAESVRIVDLSEHAKLPPKGDVSDWAEADALHDADMLGLLVDETPPYELPKPSPQDTPEALEHVFWYIDERKGLKIDRAGLLRYLASIGYRKAYLESDLESTFIRIQDNIVDRVSPELMTDAAQRYITSLPDESIPGDYTTADVEAAMLKGVNVYFSERLLKRLPKADLQFKRDERGRAFFYFADVFVEVTPEGFEAHDYNELDGHVWREQMLDRDFVDVRGGTTITDSNWHDFLRNVSGATRDGDDTRLRALMSAVGYLLHGYKDPANAKAVVFMDEKDSEVPNGRTGKSIVAKAIAQLMPTTRIDARNFSFDSRFAFQDVRLGTRVVDFNDASKGFDFERLFSVITDDWQVERKGMDRINIPFSDAPKIMISTNYVLEGQGGSFEDRVFQIEFAPHYGPNHKPEDEHGERFFEDWHAPEDWAAFDNLMLAAVRMFLRDGLQSYEHVNLKYRKLKQETCPDFAEWAVDFFEMDREYGRKGLWRSFKDAYDPDYEDLSNRKFGYWLASYTRVYNLKKITRRKRMEKGRKRFVTLSEKE